MDKPVVLFVELKIAAKIKYICEIAEKLFLNNIPISIYSKNDLPQIDNQLWTWKQESFIPHRILKAGISKAVEPVLLFNDFENPPDTEAIILSDPLSFEYLQRYKLVVDFAEVYHSEKKLESRKRFKNMRDSKKFDIHFTQLGAILARKTISLN